MKFSNSVTIRRPPTEVFAFLSDPANIPKWNYAVTSTRQLTPGPFGMGTRFEQTRSVPRTGVEELEVTEFLPGYRISLQGDIGPLTGTLVYQIDEVAEGSRLTNSADLTARGAPRLLAMFATSRVRKAVDTNLEKLRELLESSD